MAPAEDRFNFAEAPGSASFDQHELRAALSVHLEQGDSLTRSAKATAMSRSRAAVLRGTRVDTRGRTNDKALIMEAVRAWETFGEGLPTAYSWNPTKARRAKSRQLRFMSHLGWRSQSDPSSPRAWPTQSAVTALFGGFTQLRAEHRSATLSVGPYQRVEQNDLEWGLAQLRASFRSDDQIISIWHPELPRDLAVRVGCVAPAGGRRHTALIGDCPMQLLCAMYAHMEVDALNPAIKILVDAELDRWLTRVDSPIKRQLIERDTLERMLQGNLAHANTVPASIYLWEPDPSSTVLRSHLKTRITPVINAAWCSSPALVERRFLLSWRTLYVYPGRFSRPILLCRGPDPFAFDLWRLFPAGATCHVPLE